MVLAICCAALKPLLDEPTYRSFEGAIRGRTERREKAETTLIGFEASDIAAAEMQDTQALVTVRFVSEQINVVRNAEGQIVVDTLRLFRFDDFGKAGSILRV